MMSFVPAYAQEKNVSAQGQSVNDAIKPVGSAQERTPESTIANGEAVTTNGGQPIAGALDRQAIANTDMTPARTESGESDTEGGLPAAVQETAIGAAPFAENVTMPHAIGESTPSLLEDPAGAISHMLASSERRADLPHDLSPIGMFLAADWVVKGVMIGLAFASLATWTVLIAKTIELAGARARAGRTLKTIRSSKTLAEAVGNNGRRRGPAGLMLRAAQEEVELSQDTIDYAGGEGLKERVSSALGRIEAFAGRTISKGTGLLATIGSVSPFVGLFGTVWGIMNSFIGISESQTTNLAVVAPGIAEALLATAIGLVAAIPAVVIYNTFARSVTGYRQLLADAASGVERLVSRDLDFRKVPGVKPPDAALASAAE